MFTRSKFAVMNADDSHSAELLRGINIPSVTYGIRCEKPMFALPTLKSVRATSNLKC